MFWRVSTYSQQTPADAILDKGHVILEDLLEVEDLAKVSLRPLAVHSHKTWAVLTSSCPHEGYCIRGLAPLLHALCPCCLARLAPLGQALHVTQLLCQSMSASLFIGHATR